jgi:hypothetical protein
MRNKTDERRTARRSRNSLAAGATVIALIMLLFGGHMVVGQSWEVIGQNVSQAVLGLDTIGNSPLIFAVDATSGDIKSYDLASKAWTRVGGPGSKFVAAGTGTLYAVTVDRRVLAEYVSGSNWTWIREGTRDVVGSQGGLYAIDADNSNILVHDSAGGGWTQVGGPGSQFVAGSGSHLYALAMDGSTVVRYEGTPLRWTQIGQGFETLMAGGDKLYGVQAGSGDIYEFSGTPMSWTRIGGPGREFTADYNGQLYALSADGAVIFSYSGTPNKWDRIGGPAVSIVAGGGRLCAIDANKKLSVYTPAAGMTVPLITAPLPSGIVTSTAPPSVETVVTTPITSDAMIYYVPGIAEALYYLQRASDPIIRAQVVFWMSHKDHAGTDDAVGVSLNTGNGTWLNYGRDDFERGKYYTYDLSLENLSTFDDISYLNIYKKGDDGMRILDIDLIINGEKVYASNFAEDVCLDNEGGHSLNYLIPRSELEMHPNWRDRGVFKPSLPFIIPREEMESRLESIVGHQLHYDDRAEWEWDGNDGHWVEVYYVNDYTMGVDLDLQTTADWWWFSENLWIDMNLHINFACAGGKFTMHTILDSKDMESSIWNVWGDVVAFMNPFASTLNDMFQQGLEDELIPNLSFTNNLQTGAPVCLPFRVTEDGDLIIGE